MELMEDTRWARYALATSCHDKTKIYTLVNYAIHKTATLDSSEDHKLVVMISSRGTQLAYTDTSVLMAAMPPSVCSPPDSQSKTWLVQSIKPLKISSLPMSTLEGLNRSFTAVPSARNSGLDRTWNLYLDADTSTLLIDSAVRTGTVDFSTYGRSVKCVLFLSKEHSRSQ